MEMELHYKMELAMYNMEGGGAGYRKCTNFRQVPNREGSKTFMKGLLDLKQ